MKTVTNIRNVIYFIIWIAILFLLIRNNIDNPSFWYDESGQFWISRGLNHFSPQYSSVGNLYNLIENNINYNLDPGGFTLALRIWSSFSTYHIFLRLLPLLFYFLSLFLVTDLQAAFNKRFILFAQ